MHLSVALKSVFQTLLKHHGQRLVQGVGHVHGGGMVIHPAASAAEVILAQHRDVEVPRLYLGLPLVHTRECSFAETYRREPGRAAEAFLCAAINRVDAPGVHLDIVPAQAGNGVNKQECASGMYQIRQAGKRLMRPGARLGVNNSHQAGFGVLVEGGRNLFGSDDITPGSFDRMDCRSATFHDILHSSAKHTIDAHDDFIPRFDEVYGETFHSGHTGAADRKGQSVLCPEHLPQHLTGLIHDSEILWIEVAQRGSSEGAQYALRHRAGTRAKKDSFGRERSRLHRDKATESFRIWRILYAGSANGELNTLNRFVMVGEKEGRQELNFKRRDAEPPRRELKR